MFNSDLIPKSCLDSYNKTFGKLVVREVPDLEIAAIAIPNGQEPKVSSILNTAFKMKEPKPGHSEICSNTGVRALRLAPDQILLIWDKNINFKIQNIDSDVYMTEQTHAWVVVELSGETVLSCLERICPINLCEDNFKTNAFARTVMEHLGSIILKTTPNTFLLLSGSSSANSFLHAIETSAKNILLTSS